MQRERVTRGTQAAMVVGWVSMAEMLIEGLAVTLLVTFLVSARLQKSEAQARQLQGDVDTLEGQVGQSRSRVVELEAERDGLAQSKLRLDGMPAQLTSLQAERDKLLASLVSSADDGKQLAAENEKLRTRLAACREYYLSMKKTLEQTTAEKQEATIRLVSATEERDLARRESRALRSRVDAETGIHRELIGLKGRMQRVAIVFDTSGSMGTEGRWEHSRAVVAAWLEHLSIGECVLVLFSTDAGVFPEDGAYLDVHGPGGTANRKRLLERIAYTKPSGRTNTLLALQLAYRYPDLDTIILFTDGEPNNPNSNSDQFDPGVAEQIYALCRQHKHIPVNTVGLGNYFKPQLSGFLMRVAQETGGSFLGR